MSALAPYRGLRVLDVSQGIAGPYCATLLAQQGADVIKVEPLTGDWGRTIAASREGLSAYAVACNAGKRSVALDAAKPAAKEVLLQLAGKADVLIQNYRPGAIERLGLGYDVLAKDNPRLVYLSISGFGPDGPDANKAGTDSVMQALTGISHANRSSDGTPRRVPFTLPDTATALYGAQAIGAALFARERYGQGRHLRVSLLEACAAFLAGSIIEADLFAADKLPLTVPSGIFRTLDGWLTLVAVNDASFAAALRALGMEAWLADERFVTMPSRQRHATVLNEEVARRLAGDTSERWSERLTVQGALFAPILDYTALRAWPQAKHAGIFQRFHQPPFGAVPLPRMPGGAAEWRVAPAPGIGQHTTEILLEIGLSETRIAELAAGAVIRP